MRLLRLPTKSDSPCLEDMNRTSLTLFPNLGGSIRKVLGGRRNSTNEMSEAVTLARQTYNLTWGDRTQG
jgi:hypothetical protein